MKTYILYGVAALTVLNTALIFTMDRGGGRVIETPSMTEGIVESTIPNEESQSVQFGEQLNYDAPEEVAKPVGPTTSMAFAVQEWDFGNIEQNSENTHIFEFTNTGNEPLIIQDAKGSCGCTVPKYPKEPIAPGATGEIEVEYKPGTQKGNQTKAVTLTANTQPEQTVLQITAMVEEVEEG